MGRLRLLRSAFAVVLGPEAGSDHHPGRHARGLVPGQPVHGDRFVIGESKEIRSFDELSRMLRQ